MRTASLEWDAVASTSEPGYQACTSFCRNGTSPQRHASRGWSHVGTRRPYPDTWSVSPFYVGTAHMGTLGARPLLSLESARYGFGAVCDLVGQWIDTCRPLLTVITDRHHPGALPQTERGSKKTAANCRLLLDETRADRAAYGVISRCGSDCAQGTFASPLPCPGPLMKAFITRDRLYPRSRTARRPPLSPAGVAPLIHEGGPFPQTPGSGVSDLRLVGTVGLLADFPDLRPRGGELPPTAPAPCRHRRPRPARRSAPRGRGRRRRTRRRPRGRPGPPALAHGAAGRGGCRPRRRPRRDGSAGPAGGSPGDVGSGRSRDVAAVRGRRGASAVTRVTRR